MSSRAMQTHLRCCYRISAWLGGYSPPHIYGDVAKSPPPPPHSVFRSNVKKNEPVRTCNVKLKLTTSKS